MNDTARMTTTRGKCQSCGMPLTADPKGGGTNADGTWNGTYCSFCYENGKFVDPSITLDGMREVVVQKLHEKGYPKFLGRLFASRLGRLERWRKAA